jgi:hypothetical protein
VATKRGPRPVSAVNISSLNATSPLKNCWLCAVDRPSTGPSNKESSAGREGKNFSQAESTIVKSMHINRRLFIELKIILVVKYFANIIFILDLSKNIFNIF